MTLSQKSIAILVLCAIGVSGIGVWLMQQRSIPPTIDQLPAGSADKNQFGKAQKPAPPDRGYVGSEQCRTCHAEIADTYRSHPMSRSLAAINVHLALERDVADQLIEPPGSRKYRVRCQDGRMWHAEFLLDRNGETIYDQTVEISFALGSGSRGRAYLLERDGRLFASPLNWYANSQKWGLAPGYAPNSHKRFERQVDQGCLICHAGRLNESSDESGKLQTPIFREHAIGCERCHGPGQQHVDWHSRRRPESEEQNVLSSNGDSIVNPVKLDFPQREDVCNQCHLQGESQQLRYGRDLTDFRPGMRLEDVLLIFVSNAHQNLDGQLEVVSQVEQMRTSTCYLQSSGRFGCLSCHDAHSVPTAEDRPRFYRKKCESCHSEAKSGCGIPAADRLRAPEANSCIACHMPSIGASNVPHTSQTDHRIPRKPKANRPSTPAHGSAMSLAFFDDADKRIPQWEVRRVQGLMLAGLAEKSGERGFAIQAETLLAATRAIAPDDVGAIEWLGVAKLGLRKSAEARELWRSGLALQPKRESLLVRLAFHSHDVKDLSAAAAYFERLFEVNPTHAAFYGRQAHILGQLGEFDRAIHAANRAIELDPTLSQAHEWLSQVHKLRQDPEKSRFHANQARQLRDAGF